ncbi:hypothetical protein chiPu_0026581, partial [Chiloscyllium punctatum]|nr:hypothetical protein [Chiloscyllium punctatum]
MNFIEQELSQLQDQVKQNDDQKFLKEEAAWKR